MAGKVLGYQVDNGLRGKWRSTDRRQVSDGCQALKPGQKAIKRRQGTRNNKAASRKSMKAPDKATIFMKTKWVKEEWGGNSVGGEDHQFPENREVKLRDRKKAWNPR